MTTNLLRTKEAAKGATIGVIVYFILAFFKLIASYYFQSVSLKADGLNNLSDIVGSVSVLIGLYLATKPADDDHHFGHNKFEPISSFITSVLMFSIGINVLGDSINRLILQEYASTDIKASIVSIISMVLLVITRRYLFNLSKKTASIGLKATATDMRNDILVSIGTLLGTLAVQINLPIFDVIISTIVALVIIYSAFEIFKESTFVLSDGFDQELLIAYQQCIKKHPKINEVSNIRARLSGNNIYVDITIKIDGSLSVIESHHITEEVEQILAYQFNVFDCDVHVEPYFN